MGALATDPVPAPIRHLLPESGTRLGPYELIRELGRGGMGVVYLARDTRLGRRVAIKMLLDASREVADRFLEALLNQNQIGILMQFNSGLPFNIRGNRDLNGDGLASDRPLFVGRNSLYLPARYNVDLRYSRLVNIRGSIRGEVIGEFKNIFNTVQTLAVNQTVQVDLAGNPLAAIPADASGFTPTSGFEQRQFQLGFRVRF